MMKKLILFLLLLFPISMYAQEGGIRYLKSKSEKFLHTDFIGAGDKLIRVDYLGNEHALRTDTAHFFIQNDTLKIKNINFTEVDPIFTAHTVYNIINGTGLLRNNGTGTWSYDNNTYATQTWVTSNFDNYGYWDAYGTTSLVGRVYSGYKVYFQNGSGISWGTGTGAGTIIYNPALAVNTISNTYTSVNSSGWELPVYNDVALATGKITVTNFGNAYLFNAIKLQGYAIASSAPVSGQFLGWNGTNWVSTAVPTGIWSTDTYGIHYSSGNVAIGGSSVSGIPFTIYSGGTPKFEVLSTGTTLMAETTSPSLPSTGYGYLWANSSDHHVYWTNSLGGTFDLTASGGGSGTVTSVAAGAGMNFTTITTTGSVTMGTPSTITGTSINSASGTTHTHALNLSATPFTVKFDTGTTEGTDLYTYNAASAKTIDIKAGTNITITKAANSITINGAAGGTGYWTQSGNELYPTTISNEVLIGSSTDAGNYQLQSKTTSSTAILGQATTATGVRGESTSSYGVLGQSDSGIGVSGISFTGVAGSFGTILLTSNSSIFKALQVSAGATTASQTNMGVGIDLMIRSNRSGNGNITTGSISSRFDVATANSENATLIFSTISGGTLQDRLTLNSAGDLTATNNMYAQNFILSSDKRLKTDIQPLNNLNWVDNINFVKYKFKTDTTQQRYGVIAQDVEKVAPELVHKNEKGIESVAYIDLLVAKIARLEERINQLEKQVNHGN